LLSTRAHRSSFARFSHPSLDKLIKRTPHCYSFSLLLDASSLPNILDPSHPLVLKDITAPQGTGAEEDQPAEGGLARFPLLFSYPPGRPFLQKWNIVSTVIARADMFYSGLTKESPRQTATYVCTLGPSHLPTDVCIWDYESEMLQANSKHANGLLAPNSASYFIAKVDPSKTAYVVVTFQANPSILGGEGGTLAGTTQQRNVSGGSPADSPLPQSSSSLSAHTALATPTSAAATPAVNPAAIPPAPAARKRVFDQLMAEVSPILHYMRHMHVFNQMQPSLGKKKN
jgi:hypothetical protein